MKKIAVSLAAVLFAAASFADIANPGYPITNTVYAATAGYAYTSADGTNALAQLATETNRAQVAENTINTNLIALLASETNRAQVAENSISTNWTATLAVETNRAKVAETAINTNLLALLVIETNRAQVAENTLTTNLAANIIVATNANVVAAAAYIAGTNAQARLLLFESVVGVDTQAMAGFTNVYNAAGVRISHTP